MKKPQWSYPVLSIILLLVCLIGINALGSFLPLRIDVTDEKLYTISEGTKKILRDFEEPVTIKFYFSKDRAELPQNFKAYAQRVEEVLREYEYLADGNVKLEVFDPEIDSEEEEWAQKYGLASFALPNGENFYMGMVALLLDQEIAIPYFDPRREKFLEYDISQALMGLNQLQPPEIGVLSSLNLLGSSTQRRASTADEWALYSELKKSFDLRILPPEIEEISDDITVLLLIHPKNLNERAQYAVDQYVMRGGHLIVLLDPNSNHEARTQSAQMGRMPDIKSDLPRLLKNWGVEFDPAKLVGDPRYATSINAGGGNIIRYPMWMSLPPAAMDADHPITSQLENLLFVDSGFLSKAEESTVEFTPLLQTSSQSGVLETMMIQFTPPTQIAQNLKTDQVPRVLAAFLRDKFKTAFPEGQPLPSNTEERTPVETGESPPLVHAHLPEAMKSGTILVIADVDFASDTFSVQKMNFMGQIVVNLLNDNLNFIINAVEFFTGDDELMSIRSRGRFARPFTKVMELENQAQMRFQEEEIGLQQTLRAVQEKLAELEEHKDPNQKRLLTAEQQDEIKRFRTEEIETRKRLREVRKILRQDIESLGNWLLGLNMLLVPAIVALVGVVSYRRRIGNKAGS